MVTLVVIAMLMVSWFWIVFKIIVDKFIHGKERHINIIWLRYCQFSFIKFKKNSQFWLNVDDFSQLERPRPLLSGGKKTLWNMIDANFLRIPYILFTHSPWNDVSTISVIYHITGTHVFFMGECDISKQNYLYNKIEKSIPKVLTHAAQIV